MTARFTPLAARTRLADQVAQQLSAEIEAGRLIPGERLPTEARLAEQFQVSRTVVREAVSRLKSLGLLESRQGSGVFVIQRTRYSPLRFDDESSSSREAVREIAEVRCALEAEAAAFAAQRRTAADIQRIRQAVKILTDSVAEGGDGVDADLQFHQAVSDAAHNPFLTSTLRYLSQFMRQAIAVTRANEARRADFAAQVSDEHAALAEAIEAGDSARARRAAARHLRNAVRRIEEADPDFWAEEGSLLARPLKDVPS